MARHADGRANFRIAAGPIIALVVVAVLLVSVSAWMGVRRSAQQAHTATPHCLEGTITVPVFSDSRDNVVDQLLRAFNASHAVAGDYCVTAARATSVAQAAMFISPDPRDSVITYLQQRGRTPASSTWPVVFWESIVLRTTTPVSFSSWADAGKTAIVSAEEPPMIRATAAAALADGDINAAVAIAERSGESDSPVAQGESTVDAGAAAELFNDVAVPFRAITLNPTGDVTEKHVRAAKAVEDFFLANIDQDGNDASRQVQDTAAAVFARLFTTQDEPTSSATPPSSDAVAEDSPTESVRVDIASKERPSQGATQDPSPTPVP